MRLCIQRNKGQNVLYGTIHFTIYNNVIHLFRKTRIVESYSLKKHKNYSSSTSVPPIANGYIVTEEKDNHKGLWRFQNPNNMNDIIDILCRMFITDKVNDRMHDGCGFGKHFSRYLVFINEKELGTIKEILKGNVITNVN